MNECAALAFLRLFFLRSPGCDDATLYVVTYSISRDASRARLFRKAGQSSWVIDVFVQPRKHVFLRRNAWPSKYLRSLRSRVFTKRDWPHS